MSPETEKKKIVAGALYAVPREDLDSVELTLDASVLGASSHVEQPNEDQLDTDTSVASEVVGVSAPVDEEVVDLHFLPSSN